MLCKVLKSSMDCSMHLGPEGLAPTKAASKAHKSWLRMRNTCKKLPIQLSARVFGPRILLDARWAKHGVRSRNLRQRLDPWSLAHGSFESKACLLII